MLFKNFQSLFLRAALAVVLLFLPGTARAEDVDAVLAKFVFVCSKQVTWPNKRAAEPNFVIGVVGDEPLRAALVRHVEGKRIANRPVVIRAVTPGEVANCHTIFVAGGRSTTSRAIAEARGKGVLTMGMGDSEAMLRFRTVDGGLVFDMDSGAINRERLKASAELLRSAQR